MDIEDATENQFSIMSSTMESVSVESKKKVAPYGSWSSPVTSELVVKAKDVIIEGPKVDPVTGGVFWVEQISAEEERRAVFQYNVETKVIVRWTDNSMDIRSRVHEYGGGSFLPYNNTLYYTNAITDHFYRQVGPKGAPEELTNSPGKRYADASFAPQTNRLYLVAEDHSGVSTGLRKEPVNTIVMIELTTLTEQTLLSGADFYSSPRVTPDGHKLAWVQWDHPGMPWDNTELYEGLIDQETGRLTVNKFFQHGSQMTPSWNQHNELLYVHDVTGWWNLYIVHRNGKEVNITPEDKEVGWPMWMFHLLAYATDSAIGSHDVVVIVGKELRLVNTMTGSSRTIETGYDSYSLSVAFATHARKVYTVAGDGQRFPTLVEVDIETGASHAIGQDDEGSPLPDGYISVPKQIQFSTTDDMTAYAYLYMPKNEEYTAPEGTLPPLLVRCHGGPTGAADSTLDLYYHFFTTRGFVILDVDYRGSTGYGTLYRKLLNTKWGRYDVADMVSGTEHLVTEGTVDPNLLFLTGTSAGGFTTLSTVAFTDIFTAGSSYSGISDLYALATDTHKFESQYLFGLLGGHPDKDEHIYKARSPIKHSFNITTPLIFFQGTGDKIVPLRQAEDMYEVLKKKGLPTALVVYQGEEHGFKRPENIRYSLESELFFFSQIGNFSLADVKSNLTIDNIAKYRRHLDELGQTSTPEIA